MDHDQRFKAMIREFFAEFIELFFPEWAKRYDVAQPEWQDKELFANPPEGSRHVVDLVCKVKHRINGSESCILIHTEIESTDSSTSIRKRLPAYYTTLRTTYGYPILPIVLFMRVGLDGIGVDSYEEWIEEFRVLQFNYYYVGLPALDGLKYQESASAIGIALSTMMKRKLNDDLVSGRIIMERLAHAPINEYQRFLLGDCVFNYMPLSDAARIEFKRMIENSPDNKVRAMHKTPYDQGIEEGLERGIEKGELSALRTLAIAHLERKFQSVPDTILRRVEQMSKPELNDLTFQIPTALKLDDLFPNG